MSCCSARPRQHDSVAGEAKGRKGQQKGATRSEPAQNGDWSESDDNVLWELIRTISAESDRIALIEQGGGAVGLQRAAGAAAVELKWDEAASAVGRSEAAVRERVAVLARTGSPSCTTQRVGSPSIACAEAAARNGELEKGSSNGNGAVELSKEPSKERAAFTVNSSVEAGEEGSRSAAGVGGGHLGLEGAERPCGGRDQPAGRELGHGAVATSSKSVEQLLADKAWVAALEFCDDPAWFEDSGRKLGLATVQRKPVSEGRKGARPVRLEGLVIGVEAAVLMGLLVDPDFKVDFDQPTVSVTPIAQCAVSLEAGAASGGAAAGDAGLISARIYHEINALPFPLSNRDKVYMVLADWVPAASPQTKPSAITPSASRSALGRRLMVVEAPISHPAAPPPGKRVRADVFGGYTLEQRGPDVLWTLFAEADIGGYVVRPTALAFASKPVRRDGRRTMANGLGIGIVPRVLRQ
eukprot:SAG11_NODE_1552_length_4697_cov_2.785124_2_plen_468_part_00